MIEDPFDFFLFIKDTGSFNVEIILALLSVILLIILSALVSGSEVSFFSLNANKLDELSKADQKRESQIRKLLSSPNKLLATILIANNFINISIIIVSYYITLQLFDFSPSDTLIQFLIQVVLITFILVLLGEITPKVYAKQNAVLFSKRMVPLISFVDFIFTPLSSILLFSTSFIDNRLKKKLSNVSMEEISQAIDLTSNNERYSERRILKSIVEFANIDVKEIMKPRTDVIALEINTSFDEVIKVILSSSYSRIPVYEDTFDNIKGILYIKDLLPYLDKKELDWRDLCHPPLFVPETKKINDLLKEFQDKKIHLSIVVDEYGGTSGIVTLEDILEEIVGEINDEFDDDGAQYSKLDENTFSFEAKTSLNDFLRIVDGESDYFDNIKGDNDTIAGIILEKTGVIPKTAEEIIFHPYRFIVESVDDRKIKRVKVVINR